MNQITTNNPVLPPINSVSLMKPRYVLLFIAIKTTSKPENHNADVAVNQSLVEGNHQIPHFAYFFQKCRRMLYDVPNVSPVVKQMLQDIRNVSSVEKQMLHDIPNVSSVEKQMLQDVPNVSSEQKQVIYDVPNVSPVIKQMNKDVPNVSSEQKQVIHDIPNIRMMIKHLDTIENNKTK